MDISYIKASSDDELLQILALQKRNAITSLSKEETEKEGFITVSHSFDMLQRMNDNCPHIIAKYNDEVIGYVLSMNPCFAEDIPVLAPMFKELENLRLGKYLVMGQVCIDKNHRQKGVFRELYATMKREFKSVYASILTEVDRTNIRSLNAHRAIGFGLLKNYDSLGQNWDIIILPT